MPLPVAPDTVQATALNQAAVITWNQAIASDSDPLSGYSFVVTASPGGATVTTAGLPCRAVFSGLTNGTAYAFTVTPANGSGAGPVSAPSASITPNPFPGALGNIYSAFVARHFLDGNNVETQFGGENLPKHGAPPRIVWVPLGGPIRPSDRSGINPNQLRTRAEQVAVYCWGASPATGDAPFDAIASYGATEMLLNNVVASLHRLSGGSDFYRTATWPPTNAALDTLGAAYKLVLEFLIPVTDYSQPMATITSAPQTPVVGP